MHLGKSKFKTDSSSQPYHPTNGVWENGPKKGGKTNKTTHTKNRGGGRRFKEGEVHFPSLENKFSIILIGVQASVR